MKWFRAIEKRDGNEVEIDGAKNACAIISKMSQLLRWQRGLAYGAM